MVDGKITRGGKQRTCYWPEDRYFIRDFESAHIFDPGRNGRGGRNIPGNTTNGRKNRVRKISQVKNDSKQHKKPAATRRRGKPPKQPAESANTGLSRTGTIRRLVPSDPVPGGLPLGHISQFAQPSVDEHFQAATTADDDEDEEVVELRLRTDAALASYTVDAERQLGVQLGPENIFHVHHLIRQDLRRDWRQDRVPENVFKAIRAALITREAPYLEQHNLEADPELRDEHMIAFEVDRMARRQAQATGNTAAARRSQAAAAARSSTKRPASEEDTESSKDNFKRR